MKELALIIIYNHKYDKNIEILERIYKDRFSNIYHLVPFYEGEKENVIPVYESSFYFQGYIAQGFKHYFNLSYKHYFFIADDMIINPVINEVNYKEIFKLDEETSFIPTLDSMPAGRWPNNRAAVTYNPYKRGVEIKNEIPSVADAEKALTRLGVTNKPYSVKDVYFYDRDFNLKKVIKNTLAYLYDRFYSNHSLKSSKYPFALSYSDILVVSAMNVKKFCHYCGAFAATDLWVELAIPTALVLSAKKINVESDLPLKGGALWTKEDYAILDKYDNKLRNLLADFPSDYIFLHPIKLSKWDVEL